MSDEIEEVPITIRQGRQIIGMLDVLSVQVASLTGDVTSLRGDVAILKVEMHDEFVSVRHEMRAGSERLDRRIGNVESRVEKLEVKRTRRRLPPS